MWAEWCLIQVPPVNPLVADPQKLVRFFMSKKHLKKKTLIIIRAALASVFSFLAPQDTPIAELRMVKQFFTAKRKTEFVLPRMLDEIWDTQLVVDHLRTWGNSEDLPIAKLQHKVIMLICLATFWRPRSDVARLEVRDIHFHQDPDCNLTGMTLVARFSKETTGKASKIGKIGDPQVCPVSNLFLFMDRTRNVWENQPRDRQVFQVYIDDNQNRKAASGDTVAKWLEKIMQDSGIDTKVYKAHSIRSASSTKAQLQGFSPEEIKRHGNWSLKCTTYEDHYYRPNRQHHQGAALAQAVFSPISDKVPTSDWNGVRATTVVRATATHNPNVARTERQEDVGSHPNQPKVCCIS